MNKKVYTTCELKVVAMKATAVMVASAANDVNDQYTSNPQLSRDNRGEGGSDVALDLI